MSYEDDPAFIKLNETAWSENLEEAIEQANELLDVCQWDVTVHKRDVRYKESAAAVKKFMSDLVWSGILKTSGLLKS